VAIARLDLEAAAAYEVIAESADDPKLKKMLTSFAKDHRRHVEDIQAFAEANDFVVEIPLPDGRQSSFVALAVAVGGLDEDAALETLIGNEHLTNRTYETALWLITDEEALAIVEKNREDERRHITALMDYAAEAEQVD
jgi:rubrerythrin